MIRRVSRILISNGLAAKLPRPATRTGRIRRELGVFPYRPRMAIVEAEPPAVRRPPKQDETG